MFHRIGCSLPRHAVLNGMIRTSPALFTQAVMVLEEDCAVIVMAMPAAKRATSIPPRALL
jgi:hypothetical protein